MVRPFIFRHGITVACMLPADSYLLRETETYRLKSEIDESDGGFDHDIEPFFPQLLGFFHICNYGVSQHTVVIDT